MLESYLYCIFSLHVAHNDRWWTIYSKEYSLFRNSLVYIEHCLHCHNRSCLMRYIGCNKLVHNNLPYNACVQDCHIQRIHWARSILNSLSRNNVVYISKTHYDRIFDFQILEHSEQYSQSHKN